MHEEQIEMFAIVKKAPPARRHTNSSRAKLEEVLERLQPGYSTGVPLSLNTTRSYTNEWKRAKASEIFKEEGRQVDMRYRYEEQSPNITVIYRVS